MADANVTLRKRQQIENAGRRMFLWVAVASAIVGIAAVVSVSLFERIQFNQRVLNIKNETVDTLKNNNEAVVELRNNVRVLNTDENLSVTQRNDTAEPLSVILDALPSNPNSSALGASLQQKLLRVDGVSIELLTVEPIAGVEDTGESSTESGEAGEILFEFVVTADANGENELKNVLLNLERSIRAIDLTSMTVEQQSSKITLTAEGRAFYQPETTVELTEKEERP